MALSVQTPILLPVMSVFKTAAVAVEAGACDSVAVAAAVNRYHCANNIVGTA